MRARELHFSKKSLVPVAMAENRPSHHPGENKKSA
jgi:hypothetical protein